MKRLLLVLFFVTVLSCGDKPTETITDTVYIHDTVTVTKTVIQYDTVYVPANGIEHTFVISRNDYTDCYDMEYYTGWPDQYCLSIGYDYATGYKTTLKCDTDPYHYILGNFMTEVTCFKCGS